jgi:ACS family tartrate transporter-like MFS transporter
MATATDQPRYVGLERDDSELARATLRQVTLRLVPFLFVLFICNYLDRNNIGIAKLQMRRDLSWLSESAYGFGAGVFFIGYSLLEVPSNLILARVGARRWMARIMISWGIVASAMMFVRTPLEFYALRFLLGVAEAGFFPGIVYYFGDWFPARERARALAWFMTAIPVSAALGNPLSGLLLGLDGRGGLTGWEWVFLVEGIPSVLLGVAVFAALPDRPSDASWLRAEQREWLTARIERDREGSGATHGLPPLRALVHPVILLASLVYFFAMLSSYSYGFWAPTIVRDALGASNLTVGLVTGAMGALSTVTMMVVGAHSDRTGERSRHAAACIAVAAIGWLGAGLLPHPYARVAALALVPAGVYGFLAPFWCMPATVLQGTAAAAGIALVNALGATGGFVGPYAVGLLKDATGSTAGSLVGLAATALVTGVLCLALGRVREPALELPPLIQLDSSRPGQS